MFFIPVILQEIRIYIRCKLIDVDILVGFKIIAFGIEHRAVAGQSCIVLLKHRIAQIGLIIFTVDHKGIEGKNFNDRLFLAEQGDWSDQKK